MFYIRTSSLGSQKIFNHLKKKLFLLCLFFLFLRRKFGDFFLYCQFKEIYFFTFLISLLIKISSQEISDGTSMQQSYAGLLGASNPPSMAGQPIREHIGVTYRIPKLCAFVREAFDYTYLRSERAWAGRIKSSLDCDVLQTITNLLTSDHPIPDLYTRTKQEIIGNFAVSTEAELRNVLKGKVFP